MCAATSVAGAAEYAVATFIDQRLYYDSNITLIPDNASPDQDRQDKSALGYDLMPQIVFTIKQPQSEFRADTRLRFSRLSTSEYDSDDQFLALGWNNTGPNTQFSIGADVDRQSTRTQASELDSTLVATRTERYGLNSGWTQLLNERNSIAVSADWSKSEFSASRFNDFRFYGADVSWLRQLTEKNLLSVAVYINRFQSEEPGFNADNESETTGLRLGFEHVVNESLSTNFSLGARDVETERSFLECVEVSSFRCIRQEERRISSTSSGITGAAGVVHTAELWSLSANLSRSVVPSGFYGGLFESDSLQATYTRQLGPSLMLDLVANIVQEEAVDSEVVFERDRIRFESRLRWRLAQRWSVRLGLIHQESEQTFSIFGSEADGTMLMLQARYEHPAARWSR